MIDLEHFKYCFEHLTHREFCTYQALLLLPDVDGIRYTTGQELYKLTQTVPKASYIYLKNLQEKQFILYELNRGAGITIFWVRKSEGDRVPSNKTQLINKFSVVITDGKRKERIRPGNIAKFCRENHLHRNGIARLIDGKIDKYLNWARAE